jgi:hypothetical protein
MATKTTQTAQQKMRAARKRLLNDFEFWAAKSWTIRTKAGDIVSLVLNRVQRRFLLEHLIPQLETVGYIRSVILKGRQQGLSTVVAAYLYFRASQNKGQKGVVIAHIDKSTQTLFDMYQRGHENMPEVLKPETKYSSKKELVFKGRDSGIQVATARGKDIGRGETLQLMHLSEVAFWQASFARENFNGLIKALPNTPGSACFVESTACGMSGQFYDLWKGAVSGTNGFVPFFSAWFESDEYRETPPSDFRRTPDENDLVAKFGLDDAQLYWRRREVAKNGLDLFHQEYPNTPEEAFITSGRPVFMLERIHHMLDKAPEPIRLMAVEQVVTEEGKVDWRLRDNPRGELKVFRERDPNETYYIGADVGVGIRDPEKSDYSVAQVLDGQKRQVAVWRGQVTPDYYAQVLCALGYHYNIAMLAPERNNHGLLVCVRVWKDLNYPNVFQDIVEGQQADRETLDIGFYTSVASKPLIIDKLRGEVRLDEIEINDKVTLQEMLSFIVTDNGKMQAEEGSYDDCVMSLAIANHIHEGKFTPVNVTDEYYVEAI